MEMAQAIFFYNLLNFALKTCGKDGRIMLINGQ